MPPRKTPSEPLRVPQPQEPSDLPSEHATCPEARRKPPSETPLGTCHAERPLRSPSEHATCPEAHRKPPSEPFGTCPSKRPPSQHFEECHVSRKPARKSLLKPLRTY